MGVAWGVGDVVAVTAIDVGVRIGELGGVQAVIVTESVSSVVSTFFA